MVETVQADRGVHHRPLAGEHPATGEAHALDVRHLARALSQRIRPVVLGHRRQRAQRVEQSREPVARLARSEHRLAAGHPRHARELLAGRARQHLVGEVEERAGRRTHVAGQPRVVAGHDRVHERLAAAVVRQARHQRRECAGVGRVDHRDRLTEGRIVGPQLGGLGDGVELGLHPELAHALESGLVAADRLVEEFLAALDLRHPARLPLGPGLGGGLRLGAACGERLPGRVLRLLTRLGQFALRGVEVASRLAHRLRGGGDDAAVLHRRVDVRGALLLQRVERATGLAVRARDARAERGELRPGHGRLGIRTRDH